LARKCMSDVAKKGVKLLEISGTEFRIACQGCLRGGFPPHRTRYRGAWTPRDGEPCGSGGSVN